MGPAPREAALPFPFYDILDWFFTPGKQPRPRPWTARRRLSALAGRVAGSGIVAAVLHLRLSDLTEACWWPADRVLGSRTLSNLVVIGPTAAAMGMFFHQGGGFCVLDNAEAVAVIGAAFRGLITLGRWWRDVAPPERNTRSRRP
ncbi:MAG: hypothetical protein HOV83_28365 [Catenulispora sp.]|nr:hypothetical protein [Catenulispora sp.]